MKPKQSAKFDFKNECDFRDLRGRRASEIETACKYEYMREFQALRDGLKNSRDDSKGTPLRRQDLPSFVQESRGATYRLVLALRKAGFPKPWKTLKEDGQKELIKAISEWENESYLPVVIEDAVPERDLEREREQLTARFPMWRFKPSEPELLRHWEQSQREYFFGFIRIDKAYNETEAAKAFKTWFSERWEKTKGGSGPKWHQRLMQLAVMRICKQERNQWKRLKLVAEFCGYNGCVKEAEAYKERCKQACGDEPMSNAAKVEMSSAQADAREFFQRLFSGENR
jgi:hypothetical protein